MPKVRYTYMDEGDPSSQFSEYDVLPPGMNIEFRAKQLVMVWNEGIEKWNQSAKEDEKQKLREFVSAVVVDAFLHEHVWINRLASTRSERSEYVCCQHCQIEGIRHKGGTVSLDQKWQTVTGHHDYCHEKKPVLRKPSFK